MEGPTCPGCRERDARIDELERCVVELTAQLRELRSRLDNNSSNSSVPPSANPLDAPKPVPKKPTGRKPGGQPGHAVHLRERMPPNRVTETIPYVPDVCENCQHALPREAGVGDPEPRWHQVVELPANPVEVTEHQAHGRACPHCGQVTWAKIPQEIRNHVCGPRLRATIAFLSGAMHLSKRKIEETVETVLRAPIALGTVSNLEQEMSAALAAAHAEAQKAVQEAAVKNVDETGWKEAGKKRWLWGAATAWVACFVIAPTRGAAGLATLLGSKIKGIICSDRWSVYGQLKLGLRQLCWAHLKRDFQKLVDRGGDGKEIGEMGLEAVEVIFDLWHSFRGGGLSRGQLKQQITLVRQTLGEWLELGCACTDRKTKAFCENILSVESALWTFVRREGVEPTNNHIERVLRSGVLWRKNAFGCHSEAGCRFVERILTAVQTLRLQKRPVLDFLYQSLLSYRNGAPAPSLLASR
jgi:transposase